MVSQAEFWDKRSKAWKKSKVGAWAKANSVKMKKIFGAKVFQ